MHAHKARIAAGLVRRGVVSVRLSASGLREERVQHFADHLLLGTWEAAHQFQLLLNPRGRPALAGWCRLPDQRFDRGSQRKLPRSADTP